MKPTVLIVDDNESLLTLLRSICSRHYSVFTASDGVDTIYWLSRGIRPQVIVCDLNMQNIDGFELMAHLNTSQLYKHIPIILLSDLERGKDPRLTPNVVRVISKPFDPLALLEMIKQVIAADARQGLHSQLLTITKS